MRFTCIISVRYKGFYKDVTKIEMMPILKITPELNKTIPWKLVVIFTLFTIGIIIIGSVYYISQRNRIFREQENNLEAIASLKIGQIQLWHSERLGDAAIIKNNDPLISRIKQYFTNENQPGIKSELTKWMESVYKKNDYNSVSLVDTSFKIRLSVSPSDPIMVDAVMEELADVIRNQKIIMTDLHRAENIKNVFIDLLIPLIDPESKEQKPFGVIILRIDPDKVLFPLIQPWPTPSKSSETLLLRKEGDSILYLNELHHQKNTALDLRLPISDERLLASKAIRGLEGVFDGVDYRNIPVVGYLARIPGFPWFMVAKVDKEELQAPMRRYFYVAVIVTALLILINAFVFGFWIWELRVKQYRRQLKNDFDRKALERHFEYLFKYANDIITLTDNDLKIVEVNDRANNTYGYIREEMIGMDAKLLMASSTYKQVPEHKKILDDNGSAFYETMHVRKNGSEFPIEISARVIELEGKKYYQSIGRDITERKQYEEALFRHTERLRNLHRIDLAILQAIESPEAIVQTALQHIRGLLKCQRASVGIFDLEKKLVRVFAAEVNSDSIVETGKTLSEGYYGDLEILRQGKMEIVEDMSRMKSPSAVTRILQAEGTRSFINVPLVSAQALYGALNVGWEDTRTFTPEELEIMSEVAVQITIAIEQANLLKETKRYAAELEERVRNRTSQLEAANKELEAFSYSVSHDLRAPLRSIHSFTKILVEEYQNKLDDEGKRLFGIVSSSATQMGELIDDLLSFSRIGKSSVNPSLLDMKSIAGSVFAELTDEMEKKRTNLKIGNLHKANGDANLIRLVWNNLISNAIKYSSKETFPEISIGSKLEGDMMTYFVKDNGVGFDMQYKHKLFGVFQRLHSESEFEGSGVGLANVQRIILKHNGRVCAEGEVGKGATFYFSLPVAGSRQ